VRIYLKAIGAGDADFAFSSQELRDPDDNVIAVAWKTDDSASAS
jgi:hypothetical protein